MTVAPTEDLVGGSVPAFPVAITKENGHGTQYVDHEFGLTKREYFAAMALQGLLAGPDYDPTGPIARAAVDHADALLKELAK